MNHPSSPSRPAALGQLVLIWTITLAMLALAAAIIAVPLILTDGTVKLTVGESATQDILAPRPIEFTSQVLTEKAQAAAAAAVTEVYLPPDMHLARQQVLLLRDILDFINNVRADSLATQAQQQADLASIRDLPLTGDIAASTLGFNETQWTVVQTEALAVLEQVMRRPVRPDQVEDLQRAV